MWQGLRAKRLSIVLNGGWTESSTPPQIIQKLENLIMICRCGGMVDVHA